MDGTESSYSSLDSNTVECTLLQLGCSSEECKLCGEDSCGGSCDGSCDGHMSMLKTHCT